MCEILGVQKFEKHRANARDFSQERKQRLIDSQEWKHYSANTSDQTNVDNITEVNIQTKIDSCGRYFGYCSIYSIQKLEWTKIAFGASNLRVYIPKNESIISE